MDDESIQHDLDETTSNYNPSHKNQRISPDLRDVEIVDLSTINQPRELRIELDLSIDENDRLL